MRLTRPSCLQTTCASFWSQFSAVRVRGVASQFGRPANPASKPGQCCMWPLVAQAASGWSAMPAALCKAHWLSDCQSPPQMGVGSTRRNCRGNLTVANCAPFAIVEDLHPATGGVGSVDQPHLLCQRRRWRERRLWGPRRRRRRTKRRRGRRRGRIGLRSWRAGKGGGGAKRG